MAHASEDPNCPLLCEDLIKAQKDIDAIGSKVRHVEAVLFGNEPDQQGGIANDIRSLKLWLRALTVFIGALLVLFGPERISAAWKFLVK